MPGGRPIEPSRQLIGTINEDSLLPMTGMRAIAAGEKFARESRKMRRRPLRVLLLSRYHPSAGRSHLSIILLRIYVPARMRTFA